MTCYFSLAEERGRWLLKIQYDMRGLDVHMDDNIGRRLNALFEILTTVTGAETDQQPTSAGATAAGCETMPEEELRKSPDQENGEGPREKALAIKPTFSLDDDGDNVFISPGRIKAREHHPLE